MRLFGYPYNNDLVICKDSPDYLARCQTVATLAPGLDKHYCSHTGSVWDHLSSTFSKKIFNATRKFTLIMYANDTTLVSHLENFSATNIAIEDELNQELSKVNT